MMRYHSTVCATACSKLQTDRQPSRLSALSVARLSSSASRGAPGSCRSSQLPGQCLNTSSINCWTVRFDSRAGPKLKASLNSAAAFCGRSDGRERRVALKLVRAGMDPAEIVARFRHEEQILASLNHPNIAQLKTRLSAPRESLRILEQTRPGRAVPRVIRIEFEIRRRPRAPARGNQIPRSIVRSLGC
jgi:serine/threonine protein kinase